jgi:uncharacterized protein YegL
LTRPEPTIEELGNNLKPLTGAETEPLCAIDTSGSMSYLAADGSTVSRWDVVTEAIGRVVRALEGKDSQAAAERAAGADEAEIGGLMTVTFSNRVTDLDDLNSANLTQKWASVKVGGGTLVVPAWNRLMEIYLEEFGDKPVQDRPYPLVLIITDGEAQDGAEFGKILAQQGGHTYVVVAVVGYGEEHDATLKQYREIEKANNHVRVLTFDSVTDPQTIADSLLALVGE